MNSYPISIVIPCSNDILIKNCLKSIDVDVEVIVSLNKPTEEVKNIVTNFPKVKVTETEKRGIALAYNRGIEAAQNTWVLLMDSDCVFLKGAIDKMWAMRDRFQVIKGKVVFRSNGLLTKVVSKLREFTTSDTPNAYSPPLLFNKKIIDKIGYYFHPDLIWSEDADFDQRVQGHGIPIGHVPEAVIFHEVLPVFKDLKNAFNYGVGRQIGKELKIYKKHTIKSIINNIFKVFADSIEILFNKGPLTMLYYFLFWNPSFRAGTFVQKWFKIYKIYEQQT